MNSEMFEKLISILPELEKQEDAVQRFGLFTPGQKFFKELIEDPEKQVSETKTSIMLYYQVSFLPKTVLQPVVNYVAD